MVIGRLYLIKVPRVTQQGPYPGTGSEPPDELYMVVLAIFTHSNHFILIETLERCGDIPQTTTGPKTTSHPSAYKSAPASKPSPHTSSPVPHQNPSTGNMQTNAASVYRYYSVESSRRSGVGTTLLLAGMYLVLDAPPGPASAPPSSLLT